MTEYLNYPLRVYPIGRLDKDSEGLLLLTNQGDLVNKIMRAGNYHEKEYLVTVDKPIDSAFVKKMASGIPILDTITRRCFVEKTGKTSFRIILPYRPDPGLKPPDPPNVRVPWLSGADPEACADHGTDPGRAEGRRVPAGFPGRVGEAGERNCKFFTASQQQSSKNRRTSWKILYSE